MPHRQLIAADRHLDIGRQFEQPDIISDSAPFFPHPFGYLFLRVVQLLHHPFIAQGYFHCIEVFPLQVLQQGQLE